MSRTAEPGELVTTAGVAPLVPLRVGMRFDAVEDIPKHVPANATLLDATEVPWMADDARYQSWGSEEAWPMTLLYLPRSYRGPVEGPEDAVGGTESAGGQVVAGTGTPTQEGYRQMMRQKSMAAHPAGKAREGQK